MDENQTWVKTLKELAPLLSVSQNTLTQWTRRRDRPQTKVPSKGYCVEVWQRWKDVKGLGQHSTGKSTIAKEREEMAKARHWELRVLEMEGKTTPTEDVDLFIQKREGEAVKILRDRLTNTLPPLLVGLEVVEIKEKIEEVLNLAFTAVAKIKLK